MKDVNRREWERKEKAEKSALLIVQQGLQQDGEAAVLALGAFFSLRLGCLYFTQGPARGEGKSTTKNGHPLDALAISPAPVN